MSEDTRQERNAVNIPDATGRSAKLSKMARFAWPRVTDTGRLATQAAFYSTFNQIGLGGGFNWCRYRETKTQV